MDQNRDLIVTVTVTYSTIVASLYLYHKGYRKILYFLSMFLPLLGSLIFAIHSEVVGNKVTAAGFSVLVVLLFQELILLHRQEKSNK